MTRGSQTAELAGQPTGPGLRSERGPRAAGVMAIWREPSCHWTTPGIWSRCCNVLGREHDQRSSIILGGDCETGREGGATGTRMAALGNWLLKASKPEVGER